MLFAGAYAVVRFAQILLLALAGQDDAALRRSVLTGLLGSTTVGVALIFAAAFADGPLQGVLWTLAILLDMAGPYLFGSEGWKLTPSHFAERHGLTSPSASRSWPSARGSSSRSLSEWSWPRWWGSPSPPPSGGSTSTWWRGWPSES
jgi:hypothetical protein